MNSSQIVKALARREEIFYLFFMNIGAKKTQ